MKNPFKKPTPSDLYFSILEFLSNSEIGVETDVFTVFKNFERNPNGKYADRGFIRKGLIINFLEGMNKNGHIHFLDNNMEPDKEYACKEWDHKYQIHASITQSGFLFLYEKNKIDETKNGNNLTRVYILVTVIFGILTLVISTCNYNETKKTISIILHS